MAQPHDAPSPDGRDGSTVAVHFADGATKLVHRTAEATVAEALHAAGIPLECPCGGNGTCGKCAVCLAPSGRAVPPSPEDEAALSAEALARGMRLACRLSPASDIAIEVPASSLPAKASPRMQAAAFNDLTGGELGLAVDLGTTTIAAQLVCAESGTVLAECHASNPQSQFGHDVVSRISYAATSQEHALQLRQCTSQTIEALARRLCGKAGQSAQRIRRVVVAANCTMAHLLLAEDASQLGRKPYQPSFEGTQVRSAQELGMRDALQPQTEIVCLPHASAFVGGDTIAGACACGIDLLGSDALLADIGTNGELALAHEGSVYCCACAMGSALEGMGIDQGMKAEPGAIDDATIAGDKVTISTIGGAPVRGICGSGLLAAVRELVRTGLVRPNGALVDKPPIIGQPGLARTRRLPLSENPPVALSQHDVRQVQLARGALRAGLDALARRAGSPNEAPHSIFVAGEFGKHLSPSSLTGTGFFPRSFAGRIEYVGNASLAGARRCLLDAKFLRRVEKLAKQATVVDLTGDPTFDRRFALLTRFDT